MSVTQSAPSPRLLTLADVAELAGVQRPVVSMWRRRPTSRGGHVPFPAPVSDDGAVARFALDDVVQYLEATRRGRNREAALDAPTLAAPRTGHYEDAVVLLALGVLTGVDLATATPADLRALAQEVDPADGFLLREIGTRSWSPELLGFVDDLRAGSFGPGDALDRLGRGPLGRSRGERVGSPQLMELISAVVQACSAHLDVRLGAVAVRGGASAAPMLDLADEQFLLNPETTNLAGLHATGDSPKVRRLRRHAALLGWDTVDGATGDSPGAAGAPVVRVRSLQGASASEILTQVDDVVLGLRPHDVTVVVAPAGTLTDPLVGDAEKVRAAVLRPGCLATALRLPRGWSREAYQQSLALWVITGPGKSRAPRAADLDGVAVDLADLAADVSAALGQDTSRHYRYLRHRSLSATLAGGAVVPRGMRARRLDVSNGTDLVGRVRGGVARVSAPLGTLELPVTTGHSRVVLRSQSLGELAEADALRLLNGVRVDPALHDDAGTVAVWTEGGAGGTRLDPFDADRVYPRAVRTEVGDVIFVEKPTPRAVVDVVGGSLVATPARVLRLTGRVALGPHLLAERLNGAAAGTPWRTVEVPDLPGDAATALDGALALSAAHRADLVARLLALDDATAALVDGVAAGVLAIPKTDRQPAHSENR